MSEDIVTNEEVLKLQDELSELEAELYCLQGEEYDLEEEIAKVKTKLEIARKKK